jgi:hypothetical protein
MFSTVNHDSTESEAASILIFAHIESYVSGLISVTVCVCSIRHSVVHLPAVPGMMRLFELICSSETTQGPSIRASFCPLHSLFILITNILRDFVAHMALIP